MTKLAFVALRAVHATVILGLFLAGVDVRTPRQRRLAAILREGRR